MSLDYLFIRDCTDTFLAGFWNDATQSGRLASFFYDRPDVSLPAFIRWCRNGENMPYFIGLEGRVLAMCAINSKKGRTAWGHFCVLPCGVRRHEGMPLQIAICVGMLAQWLYARNGQDYAIDRVLGTTPAVNGPALKAAHRMGGHDVATIPGSCFIFRDGINVDGIVTEHTRLTVPVSGLYL